MYNNQEEMNHLDSADFSGYISFISSRKKFSKHYRCFFQVGAVGLPMYECSGNSENSGNSLYAKVSDVALKEETAYAVVACEDKDYDFVNGELVRRQVSDEKENGKVNDGVDIYDTPISPPTRKQFENTENSGASGIYEIVPEECKKNVDNTKLMGADISSSDIYDSCGPSVPPAAPPRETPGEPTMCRRGSSQEKLNAKHKEENKSEKHEHGEEKQKSGGLFKSLKFGHSRKSKKNEQTKSLDVNILQNNVTVVDIPVDSGGGASVGNVVAVDNVAPPPPSVDKLMHISAHRKQHSQSDINLGTIISLLRPSHLVSKFQFKGEF